MNAHVTTVNKPAAASSSKLGATSPRNRWPLAATTVVGISHEGDTSLGAKPSSEQAFHAAMQAGLRHIETDIRFSSDGFGLAIHTVSGTIGRRSIAKLTRAEIEKSLGLALVDLDVMMAAPFEEVLWNLEVKSKADAQGLLNWMQKNPEHVDRICVSWGPTVGVAKAIRRGGVSNLFCAATVFELLRGLLVAPIINTLRSGPRPVPAYQCAQYHRIFVGRTLVRYHHARGVAVHAWGVTTQAQMDKLLRQGIDGILSTNSSALHNVETVQNAKTVENVKNASNDGSVVNVVNGSKEE
jgi:hypothetical protein